MASDVRPATTADVPPLSRAFARAYANDPLMSWFLPLDDGRVDRLERFFAAALGRMIASGRRMTYTTGEATGAAVWAAPGTCEIPVRAMIPGVPAMFRALGLRGMVRSARAYAALHASHPERPHWYLETLATDPDAQGAGVATSVMRPILERCDREGVHAYLETQVEANVPFYERRGFVVTGELDLPRGPHMWLMLRRPGG